MEFTAQYFHSITEVFAGSQFRFAFLALIALVVFFKGLRIVFTEARVLNNYYQKSKRERVSFLIFILNNIHNIAMYLLVFCVTVFSAYLIYFSSEGIKSIKPPVQKTETSIPVKK